MSVEARRGRAYLYTARRRGGWVVKEYLGPLAPEDAALVRSMAATRRDRRTTERLDRSYVAEAAAGLVAALDPFDGTADRVVRAALHLMGYRRHHRGEWRRQRGVTPMGLLHDIIDAYGPKKPDPALVRAVSANPEQQKVLDAAAAGDASALPAVRELLRDKGWLSSLGSVAGMAQESLVRQVAGDDLAVAEAVRAKLKEHRESLLAGDGAEPPYLLRLAATRAAHCWVAVHALEVMATRYKIGSQMAMSIERQLASAERRLAAALKSLAVLRRLNRPAVVAQVNVSNGPMVVANG